MKNLKSLPVETINFSIQGKNESHNGVAEILPFYTSGMVSALTFFENNNKFKTNKIGNFSVNEKNYTVYENYADSGSADYYYFAIELID